MLACLWWGQILLDHIKSSTLCCAVHHHTYTAKAQQAGNDSLLFCTTGTFSLSFYLFLSLFLCACHLAVDSNVCCAARCTCSLLLHFLHPFLFLTSISLHTGELDYVGSCDKDIRSSKFKGTVHSKMIFCHHWPTLPLKYHIMKNEKLSRVSTQ